MDKTLLNDMLELVTKEIERLNKLKKEILLQLQGEGRKPNGSGRQRARRDSETSRAEKTITLILSESDKPLSPKQIVEVSQKNGTPLKANLVRQLLSRGAGEKFHSPRRGLWELKRDHIK